MTNGDSTGGRRGLSKGRLEAFSDGVFAIAITLLVLDIAVPAGSGDNLLEAVGRQWPSYLGYLVSFATIGAVWLAHSVITDYLGRVDAVLVRINLLLLLAVAFLPFPTRLLVEYVGKEGSERVAATLYGLNLFLASLLVSSMWHYAVRQQLVRPDADDDEVELLTRRLTPGLAGYVVLIALGLLLPTVAVVGYLAVAVYFLVPVRHLRARSR
jgi:uncharacterized membrane protein